MGDAEIERALWWWTVTELLAFLGLFVLISASLLGYSTGLDAYARRLRLAGLVAAFLQVAAPLWVYYDIRTRPESPDVIWIHVAAVPAINLVGLLGYLLERQAE